MKANRPASYDMFRAFMCGAKEAGHLYYGKEEGMTPDEREIWKALNELECVKKVYFFEPLEKEISVDDMQKIVDANEKIVKELKDADR